MVCDSVGVDPATAQVFTGLLYALAVAPIVQFVKNGALQERASLSASTEKDSRAGKKKSDNFALLQRENIVSPDPKTTWSKLIQKTKTLWSTFDKKRLSELDDSFSNKKMVVSGLLSLFGPRMIDAAGAIYSQCSSSVAIAAGAVAAATAGHEYLQLPTFIQHRLRGGAEKNRMDPGNKDDDEESSSETAEDDEELFSSLMKARPISLKVEAETLNKK